MAVNNPVKITDDTKLSELTVGDLKAILREVVEDIVQLAVFELEQQLPDADAGKELRPEFAEALRKSMQERGELKTLEEVRQELGLDE